MAIIPIGRIFQAVRNAQNGNGGQYEEITLHNNSSLKPGEKRFIKVNKQNISSLDIEGVTVDFPENIYSYLHDEARTFVLTQTLLKSAVLYCYVGEVVMWKIALHEQFPTMRSYVSLSAIADGECITVSTEEEKAVIIKSSGNIVN